MSDSDISTLNTQGGEPEASHSTPTDRISIRVSLHSYFSALLMGSFFSAYLFYLELDVAGVVLFAISWILVPFFALRDRIIFDGRALVRTGTIPRLWAWLNTSRRRLKITDIEQVETHATRAIKRGGNVVYRYRTVIRGKGLSVAISSGGSEYRHLVRTIFNLLPDNVLDNRSLELRDHLADPRETLIKAEISRIPAAEVLEGTLRAGPNRTVRADRTSAAAELPSEEKVDDLRNLANELRLSGYLLPALEAFRRALLVRPADAHLIFEFARCLHSFAGMTSDPKLERRALAALRLSERRGSDDGELLVRLGEWYFQIGEWRRAGTVFHNALERIGENYRTARGLAEIALREGKIAHVIHQFSTANRIAETPSLRRWSKSEAEYFSHLNSDEEYMELEIGRVNMLETVERSKKTVLRIACIGFPAIIFGIVMEDSLIANIGWAVSAVSLLAWTFLLFATQLLSQRLPHNVVTEED